MKLLIAALLIILLGLQYRLWIGEGSFANIDRLDQEIELQSQQNTELGERNEALVNEVEELQGGMDAIEEHARNELGLIREGETFFLIIEDENQASRTNVPASASGTN